MPSCSPLMLTTMPAQASPMTTHTHELKRMRSHMQCNAEPVFRPDGKLQQSSKLWFQKWRRTSNIGIYKLAHSPVWSKPGSPGKLQKCHSLPRAMKSRMARPPHHIAAQRCLPEPSSEIFRVNMCLETPMPVTNDVQKMDGKMNMLPVPRPSLQL